MIVLCANAVVIGVQTDYMATNNLASVPWTLRCFDIGLLGISKRLLVLWACGACARIVLLHNTELQS